MIGEAGYIDWAQIILYVFWAFFAYLVFHLQQESRREGFPLEDEAGNIKGPDVIFTPKPKTWHLPHGHGTLTVPNDDPRDNDRDDIKLEAVSRFAGTAYRPGGDDPMKAGVGPGAWTQRSEHPDLTAHGDVKIVPMRVGLEFKVANQNIDPRGLRVVGHDGVVAGTVSDIWCDRAEQVARYFEVALDPAIGEGSVLIPYNFAYVKRIRGREELCFVNAIKGGQFADVPRTASPDQVTFREEDKIMGYYGAGLFYSDPSRHEVKL
ncbi:MAG: photosynthetic reaction center subunit H [Pseudomonadota bacterium]